MAIFNSYVKLPEGILHDFVYKKRGLKHQTLQKLIVNDGGVSSHSSILGVPPFLGKPHMRYRMGPSSYKFVYNPIQI